jgi:predicted DNA-binding protein with PD1-like motif
MEYSIGQVGRSVVMRLSEGDPIYESILTVARNEGIAHAVVWAIGGVKNGGVVVGPRDQNERPLKTVVERFSDARELVGIGTVFPGAGGQPRLHLHAAIGKGREPLVGCPREGLECWLVTEIVLMELVGVDATRMKDSSGLELLRCMTAV